VQILGDRFLKSKETKMCAKKYKDAYGIFLYTKIDVERDPIVLEFFDSGMACGPIENSWVYLCKNIKDVAKTCSIVLTDLIECDFIDKETYVSNIICEYYEENDIQYDNSSEDSILDIWKKDLSKRLTNIDKESGKTLCKESFRKIGDVVSDYGFYGRIEIPCLLSTWVKKKANHDWLINCLAEYDDDGEEKKNNIKKLNWPKDAALIAKAINKINVKEDMM